MHVLHDRQQRVAVVVFDEGEPVTIENVNQHQLVDALWQRDLILGATSHWTPTGNQHRHGLDHAPTHDKGAA